MKAYILTWNPNSYEWDDIDDVISSINKNGFDKFGWTCMSSQPSNGDVFYIVLLGTKIRGIVGSGIVENISLGEHSDFNKSGHTNIVNGKITNLINPYKDPILDIEILKKEFPEQLWNPRQSGIRIKEEYFNGLWELWTEFTNRYSLFQNDINEMDKMYEGNTTQILSTRYERNKVAREKCIEHFGYVCNH